MSHAELPEHQHHSHGSWDRHTGDKKLLSRAQTSQGCHCSSSQSAVPVQTLWLGGQQQRLTQAARASGCPFPVRGSQGRGCPGTRARRGHDSTAVPQPQGLPTNSTRRFNSLPESCCSTAREEGSAEQF